MWRSVAESIHERVPSSSLESEITRDVSQQNCNHRENSGRPAALIEPSAMSPTLSHSRLFKATRRFIVAEVTLIIVIVILFAWSTYVLFRLFAGDNETIFGFSIGSQPQSIKSRQQVPENPPNITNHQTHPLPSQAPSPTPIVSQSAPALYQSQFYPSNGQPNLGEQLANYKNQILKELIARQQRLLSVDASGRSASLLAGRGLISRSIAGSPHQDGPREGGPIQRAAKPPEENSLIYLEDAPSLMQLSSKSRGFSESPDDDSLTATTTTISPNSESESDQSDSLNEQTNQIATTLRPSSAFTTDSPETTTSEPATDEDHEESSLAATTTTTAAPGDEEQQSSSGGQDQEDTPDQINTDDNSDGPERAPSEPTEDERRAMKAVKTIDEEVDRMTQPSLGVASQQTRRIDQSSNGIQFDDALPPDQDENHLEPSPTAGGEPKFKSKTLHIEPAPERLAPVEMGRMSTSRRVDRNHLDHDSDLQAADNRNKAPIAITNSSDAKSSGQSGTERTDSKDQSQSDRLDGARKRALLRLLRSKRAASEFDFDFNDGSRQAKGVKLRRSDDDEDAEDDPERGSDQDSAPPDSQFLHGSQEAASQQSEPTFEQLLAHKQLLDALQQSLPPAPLKMGNSTLGSVATPTTPIKAMPDSEAQSAGSHYTVDHGLLLYPSADEEHHHKSKSHKSHKASKKKDKKKMTVAMKKGGHKRKKHKKEEKKYHKEKKFKGAKKGKKMKKGKGGKGGKKGKKLFKDKGYKKKGFKNTYVKNEFGSKKSYFDEFRDKDFKKKWKNFDDKYNYAQMKKWQAKDVKKAKKMKDHGEKFKKYDKGKWKKQKFADMSSGSKKSMAKHHKDF